MATTPGPGNGTTTGAPAPAPRRAARQAARTNAGRAWRRVLGITVLVVAFIFLVVIPVINTTTRWLAQLGDKPTPSVSAPTPTPVTYSEDEPPPLDPNGVQSFTEFVKTASPAQWAAAEELGYSRDEIRRWAAMESLQGKDFRGEVEPGTAITNTGARGRGYYTLQYVVKDGDTAFLFSPAGKPAIKVSCGNPVGPPKEVVAKKPPKKATQKYCPPPKGGQGKPETPEVPGSIGQKVSDHKSSPTPTGSPRGEAEETTRRQDENAGSNEPVPGGISDPSPPPPDPEPEFKGETPTSTVPGI